jgi:ribosomal protein S18 acetylase RimI-like enzyme
VIELAVLADHRRKGIATALPQHLLYSVATERVSLVVRPEAAPARAAYAKWGYRRLGPHNRAPACRSTT